jgi:hypothetical protein
MSANDSVRLESDGELTPLFLHIKGPNGLFVATQLGEAQPVERITISRAPQGIVIAVELAREDPHDVIRRLS